MKINPIFEHVLILIKGAGDLASGVAYRLKQSGFPLIMTELPTPSMVRRAVCFGEAVYSGQVAVEGITARRVESVAEARRLANTDIIPILVAPQPEIVATFKPKVLVDAIMAKVNTGAHLHDAPLVIALGPGFVAGRDCHAVVETNRGHWLGRVIYTGQPEPDTGRPGPVKGQVADRVLRAPAEGHVVAVAHLGDQLQPGQLIARVADQEVRAPFAGVLRGLVHPRVPVTKGFKIGDLDPRGVVRYCFTISDKSLAIGGGVLEAILASDVIRSVQNGDS